VVAVASLAAAAEEEEAEPGVLVWELFLASETSQRLRNP
jgi:hypothetical protein